MSDEKGGCCGGSHKPTEINKDSEAKKSDGGGCCGSHEHKADKKESSGSCSSEKSDGKTGCC